MAWASQKSQLNVSLPIKKQKIHEKHGSSVYCTQPALPHPWCLFDGVKLKTLVNGKGSQERSKGSFFFFLNPLRGIRVLSPLPWLNKYLSLDRVFFPLPWHQLKDYHLLLLVAAALHSNRGGSVYTGQLRSSSDPPYSAYRGSGSILGSISPSGGGKLQQRGRQPGWPAAGSYPLCWQSCSRRTRRVQSSPGFPASLGKVPFPLPMCSLPCTRSAL